MFPASPAAVDDPPGVVTRMTRPPAGAPAAMARVKVACVPLAFTVRFVTVIARSVALFLRNVTLVVPPNPDPASVRVTFAAPAGAPAGLTAVLSGWKATATPAAVDVDDSGDGIAWTRALTGAAALVPGDREAGPGSTRALTGRAALVAGGEDAEGVWTRTLTGAAAPVAPGEGFPGASTRALTGRAALVAGGGEAAAACIRALTGAAALVAAGEEAGGLWTRTLTPRAACMAGSGAATTSTGAEALSSTVPVAMAVSVTAGGDGTLAGAV